MYPYSPVNGIVERKGRYLLNVAKALKFQAKVPKIMGRLCLTATFIINRVLTFLLNEKSPFETLFKRGPWISHECLGTFLMPIH